MAHIPMNPNPKRTNNDPINATMADVVLFPLLIVAMALGALAFVTHLI
ncbi:hypothetical protein JJB07_01055 [Tumebacillus sp. ITR2]|uniref:Biopolymer transporter ExbD n=1 Tax=Tumebacillus amylolyticus TaxID=2801339 RepID=A0ABS1J5C1_9BACL|nr:hypothetical protein [Tumebacillus amylolyticus]MBL0385219.1 hypothetical protein [Tumebacillus amylolyticus]